MRPNVRYAPVDDGYVAYSVTGSGPDVVYHCGWYTHLDAQWDFSLAARFIERLASFSRVIMFDRRGHGMSDPVDLDDLTLERWMEDLRAVMDAVGSERAVLIGEVESGPMQILHAATHPEKTAGLILINSWACPGRRSDFPVGLPESVGRAVAVGLQRLLLGDPSLRGVISGNLGDDETRQALRVARYATSPMMARRLSEVSLQVDVRGALPTIQAPTLIIHRRDQEFVRFAHGRYLADHIADAKLVELPGNDLLAHLGDQDAVLEEIEEFVTGVRPIAERDRILATVLFTDIVSSTEQLVAAGDRQWREKLEAHNQIVRRELQRHRGVEINTAGDGFLATFDGPARAVRCACAIAQETGRVGIGVRAGLHTGEVELSGSDVAGIAVHIGARVGALAQAGEVLVSRTVVDLVAGSELQFDQRGAHVLKGVPGEWQLYAVAR